MSKTVRNAKRRDREETLRRKRVRAEKYRAAEVR